jgi:hypothetical protein
MGAMTLNRTEQPFIGGPLAGQSAPNERALNRIADDGHAMLSATADKVITAFYNRDDRSPETVDRLARIYMRQTSTGHEHAYVWAPI